MKIGLPEDVEKILNTLKEANFEGYVVGGCVRDSIMKRNPKDWDITTNAKPEEVKELFSRTVDTGLKHGTVTVMMGKVGYEVTTYRIDGDYKDGRHPESVTFAEDVVEDLKRRDFTINAMAYNTKDGLRDEFGGISDIRKGMIRCVGTPTERFGEDALRMMRAIRFAAQLGFTIHRDTMAAIVSLAKNIEKVSKERIQMELTKTLLSDRPESVDLFVQTGLAKYILPELDEVLTSAKRVLILRMLKNAEATASVRYAVLFFDLEEERARKALRSLKLDNETINQACKLIRHQDEQIRLNEVDVREAMYELGSDFIPTLINFKKNVAKSRQEILYIPTGKSLIQLDMMDKMYRQIIARGDCVTLKDLKVNGKDLMELGMQPGSELGEMLILLLHTVLENPLNNEKETLLALVEGKLKEEDDE
ncbi:MAG: CCA tRNA nucleotidyltransferase [Lachnospiraceae bacterium]|nr:CCA tRNA nucleotidyltransferase [Lachnospiraceae bacterium]